jgi:hypothetical protein
LQFAQATTTPKIAEEYVFANANNQSEGNKASGLQSTEVKNNSFLL